ncbi:hypothetical protein AKG95_10355 [Janthinobacterium lividum]|jgi:hypothetical protein|uniref:Uncharacterized protein n=1 Tax=Janthinobacterium lividum TaxID=29581 RepID=A0A1S1UD29_9BURK|nr:hypothetical protein [Janthinobacterium lividum]OHV97581.1 hypothetical protein AKG95_10355 [Janthinobacterium lividum]
MLALMGTFRGINPPDGLHGIDVAPSPAMCRAGAPGRTMQIMCHAPQLLDFSSYLFGSTFQSAESVKKSGCGSLALPGEILMNHISIITIYN